MSNVHALIFLMASCFLLVCPDTVRADSGMAILQPGKKIDQARGKYKKGELLVKFNPDIPDDSKAETHKKIGSTVIIEYRSIGVQHVRLKEGLNVETAVRLYQANSSVEYAEPVSIVEIQK